MKINEITNAEDILALWKLISDNTWSAIQQQAEQQAREKAERAAKTKSTKGSKRGTGRKPPPIVVPKPKPPARPAKPQAKPAVIAPVQQPLVAQGPLPSKGPLGCRKHLLTLQLHHYPQNLLHQVQMLSKNKALS